MNRERMILSFKKLVSIHSPSGKERKVTDYLIEEFKKRNMEVFEEDGFKNYDGDSGVLFAKLKGNKDGKAITLQAHSDVVGPNEGVVIIEEDNLIKTDGKTTLGGDDKGGVAIILEVLDSLIEGEKRYPDIFVMITVGEETGLIGVKNINWDILPKHLIPAEDTIVIDNAGRSGLIAYQAPGLYKIYITFKGRKAHGGIEPEKGINSIVMASKAISKFKTGRVDEFTTSNIGMIKSDFPTNVVADTCEVVMEARGHDEKHLLALIDSYEEACKFAVEEMGGEYTFIKENEFPQLLSKDKCFMALKMKEEYEKLGIDSSLQIIGGGSDANILSGRGYNSIIVGCGMYKVHTTDEYLNVDDMVTTTKAVLNFITMD